MVGRQERLHLGLGPTKAEAVDELGMKVEFAADQSMRPQRVDGEAIAEHAGAALIVGAADEDSDGRGGPAETLWRPGEAQGSGLLAILGLEVMGLDEAGGAAAQVGGGGMVEALPDFCLPQGVEGFNLVLQAVFAGGSEDGGDAQGQAEDRDGAQTIGMMVRAVKAQVVVELGVGWQTMLPPVGQQRVASESSGDGGSQVAAAQASVQGDGVEDLDFGSAFDDETFDDIEAVQLVLGVSDVGQMPARRGRWAPEAAGPADQRVALEHIGDGGSAGQSLRARGLGAQGAQDGDRSELAQSVAVAEVVPQREDALHHGAGEGAGAALWAPGSVPEFKAVQPLCACAPDPVLDVGEGHPKATRDLAQRHAAPCQADDLAAVLRREFFTVAILRACWWAVSSVSAPLRSAYTPLTAHQPANPPVRIGVLT